MRCLVPLHSLTILAFLINNVPPLCASFNKDFLQGDDNVLSLFENENHHSQNVADDLDLSHFDDEQSFLYKFGDDVQVTNTFNKTSQKRIHDTDRIPGDWGIGIKIESPSPEVQAKIEEGYKIYAYNKFVSDLIPIDRRLPDRRSKGCFTPNRISPLLLPTSVIICTYNEALSVLLRTIQSIVSRSPQHLLAEILLIDDFSDNDDLKYNLEEAIRKNYSKVKLIRLPKREGVIRCRLHGSLLAHAPILTFLDSHIEVGEGWLEPLLDKVTKNWKTIAVPVFHTIDPSTFGCKFMDKPITSVGGFKWDLMFTFKEITEWDIRGVENPEVDPIPTPTLSGGFYSIHKDFFSFLGGFDDQFEIWGGENLEISFKAWMCGGRIEILPCSHVAHLERTRSVYARESHVWRNSARLAAVWLDDFAPFYFSRAGKKSHVPSNYGDISSRLDLKKSRNCSSFDWYLNNIYPEMMNPKSALAYGELRNLYGSLNEQFYCLDSHEPVKASSKNSNPSSLHFLCHGMDGNQFWYHTSLGEIRQEQKCLDYFGGESVVLFTCHELRGNQEWEYHGDTGIILHVRSQRCLTLDKEDGKLKMRPCQGLKGQRWKFEVDTIHQNLNNFIFPYNAI